LGAGCVAAHGSWSGATMVRHTPALKLFSLAVPRHVPLPSRRTAIGFLSVKRYSIIVPQQINQP
jgi:hypothetical protein